MKEYKTRTEFAQAVADWCKKANGFYSSSKSITPPQTPKFLDEVGELEEQRLELRQAIRKQPTGIERKEFTEVYNFRIGNMGAAYELHSDLVNRLKR